LAAREPVLPDEGFAGVYVGEEWDLAGILSETITHKEESLHEYCHQAG
jgi:hypothetical protein